MKKNLKRALFAGIMMGLLLYLVLPLFGLPNSFVLPMSGSMSLVSFIVFLFPPKAINETDEVSPKTENDETDE